MPCYKVFEIPYGDGIRFQEFQQMRQNINLVQLGRHASPRGVVLPTKFLNPCRSLPAHDFDFHILNGFFSQ